MMYDVIDSLAVIEKTQFLRVVFNFPFKKSNFVSHRVRKE